MPRFVNAQRSTYHHNAITEFSDISHLIATGVAKGYASNKYSWVSDFLFKHAGNTSINAHIGYASFYSERDIFQQEYGNVVRLQEQYPFLSEYDYATFPKHYTELSTRQYFKVGQKFSEYDIIQYVNVSRLYPLEINLVDPDPELYRERVEFKIRHGYYRSPAFYAQGYKFDMADNEEGSKYEYFNRYLWTNPKDIEPNNSIYKEYYLNENDFDITLLPIFADYYGDSDIPPIIAQYQKSNNIKRMFDYKVHIDNLEFHHFPAGANNWIINQRNSGAGSGKYYPYVGFVQCFLDDWKFISPYYDFPNKPPNPPNQGFIRFYPEITQNGVMEPAKVLIDWGHSIHVGAAIQRSGSAVFHSGVHLGEADDQSRIVYNICRHMTTWDDTLERFVLFKKAFNDDDVLFGLDLDTERNRRNSAVVMTEPYFTVRPIANGQAAKISFVDYKNNPIEHTEFEDFENDPSMYLKIKAPLTFIKELDRYLALEEINTDIIDTLIIKNPRNNWDMFNEDALFYDNFGDDDKALLYRQEFCLDDLVGGIVGTGKHRKFFITAFGPRAGKYSDDEMKVSGMGFVCRTTINQAGDVQSAHNEYLHVYCNNHIFTNAPAPSTTTPPLPNVDIEVLTDTSIVTRIQQYEKFRPMLKLPGINGYIKILERNPHFKVKRAPDGEYEIIYNVEFPFCPGSVYERIVMNFGVVAGVTPETNDMLIDHQYLLSQIFYKADYINAGSWEVTEVGPDERYDLTNERYAPFGDDSCTHHELFQQISPTLDVFNHISIPWVHYYYDEIFTFEKFEKPRLHSEIIQYPAQLIWEPLEWTLLSLIKPQTIGFEQYGTYNINALQNRKHFATNNAIEYFSSDLKLIALADNRQWQFDKDKYTSFIGRENPAYICEMDVSTLFEDFRTYQIKNGAIPDVKRWFYGYFSGFAHMIATTSDPETKSETTAPGSESLTTQSAQSNIAIEIWDAGSDIGNGRYGNWRPLSSISSDTEKIAGELILDNMFIYLDDDPTPHADHINEFGDIWSFYLGHYNPEHFPSFPPEWQLGGEKFPLLDGQSNLVLSDSYGIRNYHIVYARWEPVDTVQAYKVWIRYDEIQNDLFVLDKTVVDMDNLPSEFGYLSIHKPEKFLSKNANFVLNTNAPSPTNLNESIIKYIDIRSQEGVGGIPDFDRYIDSENKIRFRIRIRRHKDYPVNYINEDTSDIQYLGSEVVTGDGWMNFPWGDGVTFNTAFDWGKVTTLERLRKLGFTYFKCASR